MASASLLSLPVELLHLFSTCLENHPASRLAFALVSRFTWTHLQPKENADVYIGEAFYACAKAGFEEQYLWLEGLAMVNAMNPKLFNSFRTSDRIKRCAASAYYGSYLTLFDHISQMMFVEAPFFRDFWFEMGANATVEKFKSSWSNRPLKFLFGRRDLADLVQNLIIGTAYNGNHKLIQYLALEEDAITVGLNVRKIFDGWDSSLDFHLSMPKTLTS